MFESSKMKTLFCHVSKLKTLGEKPTVQGDDHNGRPPQGTPANVDIPLNFQISKTKSSGIVLLLHGS